MPVAPVGQSDAMARSLLQTAGVLALVVASAAVLVQVALNPTDQHVILALGIVLLLMLLAGLIVLVTSGAWWLLVR